VRNSGYHELPGILQLVIDVIVLIAPLLLSFVIHDHVAILAAFLVVLGLVFVAANQ